MDCNSITPVSAFQSTNLNSQIASFSRLGDRITRSLGAPMVNIEIHRDQLFENISIACELFSKYAGYTEEYLVFDSNLYEPKNGIKLDSLFSITPAFNRINKASSLIYVTVSGVPASTFSTSPTLSSIYPSGIYTNQILTNTDYLSVFGFSHALSANFVSSGNAQVTASNAFDYDIMDYRKVIDVIDFEEGSSTGVNTLFTIEQTLAQQTYFSYSMGNYGFDLISWYVLKDWMKNREKMLAQKRSYTFNDRTQCMTMHPAPGVGTSSSHFYGIVSCYVEKPLKDLLKEQWVYQYALALSKISVGNVRGKYTGTTLFGGGTINIDMLAQGLSEKEKLEQMLFAGASPGMGDGSPISMMVG